MTRDVTAKTAFITGGASGMGLAMARPFASAGMKVAIADIEEGALDSGPVHPRDAIVQHPEEPRLHQMMANAYLERGDVDNGRRHLEKIIAFAPENARALEELGWLIARQGETEQGIALLEKALESGAREPKQVLYRLGLLDGTAGRWQRAAERFRDAGRIDAAFTMAFVHLGRCLAEAGDFDASRAALDWADRLDTHAEHRASARRRLAELQQGRP